MTQCSQMAPRSQASLRPPSCSTFWSCRSGALHVLSRPRTDQSLKTHLYCLSGRPGSFRGTFITFHLQQHLPDHPGGRGGGVSAVREAGLPMRSHEEDMTLSHVGEQTPSKRHKCAREPALTCSVTFRLSVATHSMASSLQKPPQRLITTQDGTYMCCVSSGCCWKMSTRVSLGWHMLLMITSLKERTTKTREAMQSLH